MSDNVSSKTKDLIDRWIRCDNQLLDLRRKVNKAECDLNNAKNELGKFLTPDNAMHDETFNIWYGDSLITVRVNNSKSGFEITVRQQGKSLTT